MKNNEQVLSVIHLVARQNVAERICALSVCAKVWYFSMNLLRPKEFALWCMVNRYSVRDWCQFSGLWYLV